MGRPRYDLVILGGGTTGIVASRIAAGLGARVALVERDAIGGECLYTGCVPSKALIASATRAHEVRTAGRLGIEVGEPRVDFPAVMAHVREAIRSAGEEDTPEYLRSRGVDVVEGDGAFAGPGEIAAAGRTLRYRAALIATGSRPVVPPIDGLAQCDPLTNESVFSIDELPGRLTVIGGGPTGCELAQAFGRLGSEVTLVEAGPRVLAREEPEASALVEETLRAEGIHVLTGAEIERVEATGDRGANVHVCGREAVIAGRVLVATGRQANTAGLGLERVGVETTDGGTPRTDEFARTTGDHIYAAGDVTGDLAFTHFAAYAALVAVANSLFRARRKVEKTWIPWATFTDPEVAHVGHTEASARERHGDSVKTYVYDYSRSDRAITAGQARGFAKLVAGPRGRLIGVTIAAPAAGESIAEAARLVRDGGSVADLSQMAHVYPTLTEGPARAADTYLESRYLTPSARRLFRPLLAFLREVDRPR